MAPDRHRGAVDSDPGAEPVSRIFGPSTARE